MPATVTALVLALLALLPGALYTWAFEQQAGRWGANATDRVQRFAGASAIFLVVELPLVYQCYRLFVASDDIARGNALPAWVWLIPLGVVFVPLLLGRFVGRATYERKNWTQVLTGPSPAPRAWDDLFAQADLTGWVLLTLKDGSSIGGLWGESDATGLRSYAAGYPESQDLLISETAELDAGGKFILDANGLPSLQAVAVLVRWDEVKYAEFIPG